MSLGVLPHNCDRRARANEVTCRELLFQAAAEYALEAVDKPDVGVGVGRSKNRGQKVRKAEHVWPSALVSPARTSESGVILECPDGS